MRKLLSIVALVAALAGCASEKYLQATGGSRSDGTIDLSYNVGAFEQPNVHFAEGLETAKARCKAWGYENAEMFGGQKTQCNAYNGYGNCMNATITITYQCLGGTIQKP